MPTSFPVTANSRHARREDLSGRARRRKFHAPPCRRGRLHPFWPLHAQIPGDSGAHAGKRLHSCHRPRLAACNPGGADRRHALLGDVGRPDLSAEFTPQRLAGMLYDSLHTKLLTLPDEVEVYPAHGAGSLCGRNISNERSSTIGQQRQLNYALQVRDRDDFVRMLTTDLPERPGYFARDAEINRSGAAALSELLRCRRCPAMNSRADRGRARLRWTRGRRRSSAAGTFPAACTSRFPGSSRRGPERCSGSTGRCSCWRRSRAAGGGAHAAGASGH